MLCDDMIICNSALQDFDDSLFIVNHILDDGVSVQLHRYDKWTVGNSALVSVFKFIYINCPSDTQLN